MICWTIGTIRISSRVSIDIKLGAGGDLTSDDLLLVAAVLEWIGRASKKWVKDAGAMFVESPK